MPVGVVQVVNNTFPKLVYKNRQSGYFIVPAQSPHYANKDWVPGSDFRDDAVTFYSSGHDIEMRLGRPVGISDADWKFSIVGQSGRSGDVVRDCYGELVNGGNTS